MTEVKLISEPSPLVLVEDYASTLVDSRRKFCFFTIKMESKSYNNRKGIISERLQANRKKPIKKTHKIDFNFTCYFSELEKCSASTSLVASKFHRIRTSSEDSDDDFIYFLKSDTSTSESEASSYMDSKAENNTEEANLPGTSSGRKVNFTLKPTVHVMFAWNFAYRSARKGKWEEHARDRFRFQQRIHRASEYLNPILEALHRFRIHKDRFT